MRFKKLISANNAIVAVYFLLSLSMMMNHEIWRDEAQAWLIARDAPDLVSFINILGYEGSPGLYHIILLFMAKAGLPVLAMQALNVLVMTAAVTLFVYGFPFKAPVKALFVFGYYMVYEYGTIARSYSLLILILFAIVYMHGKRHEYRTVYPLLILLLANVSLHGTIIAIAFIGELFIDMAFIKKQSIRAMLLQMAIPAAGIAAAVFQILPPPDLGAAYEWKLYYFPQSVSAYGMFPLLSNGIHFWNSNAIPAVLLDCVLGVIALALPAVTIKRLHNILLCYSVWIEILIILCLRYCGGYRHAGLLFIIYIAVLWIDCGEVREGLPSNTHWKAYAVNIILPCIFALGVVSSSIALYYDINYDFSSSKKAADFLKNNGYADGEFIIAYPAYCGSGVSAYLGDHSKFYSIEYNRDTSFMVWNKTFDDYSNNYYGRVSTFPDIDGKILAAMKNRAVDEAILVTDYRIGNSGLRNNYETLAAFNETIVNDECFYIYRIKSGKE